MPITATAEREQLIRDGFCVFEQVLDADTVAGLNEMSEWTLAQVDPSHFADNRARGSIIPYWTYPHPAFTQLLGHAGALAVFASLGFDRPKVWSGFVISKPPHSPPLHWHQDGLLWGHPISYTDQPQQFFLMSCTTWSTPAATTAACGWFLARTASATRCTTRTRGRPGTTI